MESVIALIPARGGSKRLPGKNLMRFGRVSLLERTIRQAKKAIPTTVVSSDYEEILREAARCEAEIIKRPAELATDSATSAGVVVHALSIYPGFEWFCLLQVTSPLRSLHDILGCIDLASTTGLPVITTCDGQTNGAVYLWPAKEFRGDFETGALHYEMPAERSIDINTQEDFDKALELWKTRIK